MPKKTSSTQSELKYILLALIRLNPDSSGYQLRNIVNNSSGYYFHAHLSQIYPLLKQMTEEGYVVFRNVERDNKPSLKLYTITDEGCKALESRLKQPFRFENTRENSDRYFMQLTFMDFLDSDNIVRYIDSGIDEYSRELDQAKKAQEKMVFPLFENTDGNERSYAETIWQEQCNYVSSDLERRLKLLRKLRTQVAC